MTNRSGGPLPDSGRAEADDLRGTLFSDLDRLAFALEMEAAELLASGDEGAARSRQELRLGVRLAQRLVAGIHADEVHARILRYAEEYEARLDPVVP